MKILGIAFILIYDLDAYQNIIFSALIDRRELLSDEHTGDLYEKTGKKIYSLHGVVDYLLLACAVLHGISVHRENGESA